MNAFADDPCPEPAVLGAFIDGTLPHERVANVTRHVSRCARCREVVEDVCAIAQELEQPVVVHSSRFQWIAAAAAAIVLVGLAAILNRSDPPDPDPIARLVAASPTSGRTVESRLSGGFRWARLRPARRANASKKTTEELLASGAAGSVLRELEGNDSPQALHARGIAFLVAGDSRAAVPLLLAATRVAEGNARVWSDLSAALYSANPDNVVVQRRALDAADRAIRLNPRLIEAYFNRALILERVGTSQQVAAAWNAYLLRDSTPDGWTAEARERLVAVSEHRK